MCITDKQLNGWIKIMIVSEQPFRELWLNENTFIGLQEANTWHAVNSHFIELTQQTSDLFKINLSNLIEAFTGLRLIVVL